MLGRVLRSFLDLGQIALDGRFPLPLDRPFTHGTAREAGLQNRDLGVLVTEGFLRRLVAGVYVANQVPDSLALRAQALRLVVPPDAVVTDRTAGWLHGAPMVLAPDDHLVIPPVSMFVNRSGARLRNDLASSGERMLRSQDVMEVLGVRVTTPLRTACDLGRLLNRDRAFAALDTMLSLGVFDADELWDAVKRFRGMRGVRQLRGFAPLADGSAQSAGGVHPPSSLARLAHAAAVRSSQIEVQRPGQSSYWLDLGVEELRYAAEYDGEEWHRRTPEQTRTRCQPAYLDSRGARLDHRRGDQGERVRPHARHRGHPAQRVRKARRRL